MEAPAPVVSSEGQAWSATLRAQYRQLLELAPDIDAGILWDDDTLLSSLALSELRGLMRRFDYDRLDVKALFFWDSPDTYNERFPDHISTWLFRVYPGDDFPADFVAHCPEKIAKVPKNRVGFLHSPSLNYGYLSADDRRLTFAAQKAAGKLDAHTLTLVKKPQLKEWRSLGLTLSRSKRSTRSPKVRTRRKLRNLSEELGTPMKPSRRGSTSSGG